MIPSLSNPKLKIERAKEHLENLEIKLREFQDSTPFRVTTYEVSQDSSFVIRCQIPIIDTKLAVIAGDAMYNLRSALDHIAWQLALIKAEKPFEHTAFPVIDENKPQKIKRLEDITRDIPTEAVSEIKGLQPYLKGTAFRDDLLWKLDKLCNIDKHRVIPASGTALDIKIPKEIDRDKIVFRTVGGAYEIVLPISVRDQMKSFPPPVPDVLFGSKADGLEVSVREFANIFDYVRDTIMPKFTRFFPQ